LVRWILLLQEFDITIKDKIGIKNIIADHLSKLTIKSTFDITPINYYFPNKSLFFIATMPWFANVINFLAIKDLSTHWSSQDKKKNIISEVKNFYWDDPYLFNYCLD
jgi:hypothetical protein